MRGLSIAFFIVIFSFETALACFEDTSVRCSRTELDIKVRSAGTTGPLFGESLGYFEWLTGCAGAAIADTVRCPGEYVIDGARWTKEKARETLRDLGYDADGVRLDVKP